MGDKTLIEWSDATWNPTTGCDKISPGCDNCYALPTAARMKRMGQPNYQTDGDQRTSGPGFGLAVHEHMLEQPLRWKRPRRIFVNSMSDLFHKDVPDEFIVSVFAVMVAAGQHTFQVLTKRPQRMAALVGADWFRGAVEREVHEKHSTHMFAGWPYPSIWLGVSIENDSYTWRADHLRNTPAAVRFISAEPLLGPLPSLDLTGIDWLIAGGESGPGARPMHPDWVRDLRDRCWSTRKPHADGCLALIPDFDYRDCNCKSHKSEHTAFFFKQWGEWAPASDWPERNEDVVVVRDGRVFAPLDDYVGVDVVDECVMARPGKHKAGRTLDGREWSEYPR